MSPIFFGAQRNAIYGAEEFPPLTYYDLFTDQARQEYQGYEGMNEGDGWPAAVYLLIFGEERQPHAEIEAPNLLMTFAQLEILKASNAVTLARQKSMRLFVGKTILAAMHPTCQAIINERQGGHNIGTARRTDHQVFDLLEAAYGRADAAALRTHREQFHAKYDPSDGKLESHVVTKEQALAFLEKNQESPSRSEQYEVMKQAVLHLSIFKATITHFEMTHEEPQRTFALLSAHLVRFSKSNQDDIMVEHAINAAKKLAPAAAVKPKPTVATEESSIAADVIAAIAKARGSGSMSVGAAQALSHHLTRSVKQFFERDPNAERQGRGGNTGQYPVGSCVNHAYSTSHTTEQCKTKTSK